MLRGTAHLHALMQPSNWHWQAITVLGDESFSPLGEPGRQGFLHFRGGGINKLDTRGLLFTCLPLSCRGVHALGFSCAHAHSKGLATGAQPCSVVETKHWPVLTGCDPCFRAERCQRRIDGSHPEEDIYRKMLLAGTLPLFILDSQHRVAVMAAPGQSVPPK